MALAGAEKSYSKIFFIASHIFVLLALYSIYDEAVVRRPWKSYQDEYNHYDLQVAEKELEAVQTKYKKSKTDEKIAKFEIELEKLYQAKNSTDYQKLAEEYKTAQTQYDDDEQDIKFKKSILDSYYYFWKHAIQEGKSKEHIEEEEKKYHDLEQVIQNQESQLSASLIKLNELKQKFQSYDDQIKELNRKVDELKKPLAEAKEKVENITMRSVEIKQVVLDYGKQEKGNIKWGRVDRCQTCHVSSDKIGMEDVAKAWELKVVQDETAKEKLLTKKPKLKGWVVTQAEKKRLQILYGTHPKKKELLTKHPVKEFGCTSCHGGNGRGVNIHGEAFGEHDKAHAYHHHAVEPLLRGNQVEANCLGCHNGVIQLPEAEKLSKGLELFTQLGCQNCHAVEGYEDMYKVAPELNRVASKVKTDWLVDWLKNPYAYMPSTRMPNFGFSNDEVVAVASFLIAQSETYEPKTYNVASGNIQNGKKLFNEVGCLGCHSVDANTLDRGRAPNLARVAAKMKDANWVADWIQNPENYSKHARMPNLRISTKEAEDLSAYLFSLEEIAKRSSQLALKVSPQNKQLVEHGKKIVGERGCYSCHTIKGFEQFEKIGPNLTAEALKEPFEFDYGDALSQDFTFTDAFGRKVYVAHLDKWTSEEIEKGKLGEMPGEPTQNILKRVKEKYAEKIANVDEVTNLQYDWQSWVRNKLKYPLNIYNHERAELKMPNFNLSPEELDALLVFLKAMQNKEILPEYDAMLKEKHQNIVKGQRLVAEKNCMGCHQIQGFGGEIGPKLDKANHEGARLSQFYPPSLGHVGMKIRPEWLRSFLMAPDKMAYRPAIYVRMPSYGFNDEELNTLAYYFAAMNSRDPKLTSIDYKFDLEKIKVGEILASPEVFNCFSCHLIAGKKPSDDPKVWAPDWTLMKERLQPEFIPLWVQNPAGYQSFSVMSPFLRSDAEAHPDYFGGSAEKQLDALKDYILSVGNKKN